MKTVERPEKTMAAMMLLREAGGKFLRMFSPDQFSRRAVAARRRGMERTLL